MALVTVTEPRGQITAPWPQGLKFWTVKTHPHLKQFFRTQCRLSRYFDQDGWRLVIYREVDSPDLDPVASHPIRGFTSQNLFYAFLRSDLTRDEARELSTTLEPVGFAFTGDPHAEPAYWAPDFERRIDPREMLKLLNTRYLEVKQGVRQKRVISGVNLPQVGAGAVARHT